jgi:cytochrome c2
MRAGFVVALTLLFAVSSAHAAGDAVAGKAAFENQCAACHTTVVGKNGFGPSLAGVIGRKSGTLAGYTYTPAMAHANLVWDAATLDQFLANSAAKVPGTSMPVEIADETTRANASAYLATLSGPNGCQCCAAAKGSHAATGWADERGTAARCDRYPGLALCKQGL